MDKIEARLNAILEQLESAKVSAKGHRWRMVLYHVAEVVKDTATAMELEGKR